VNDARSDFAIETQRLSRFYGDRYALRDLTLAVPRGGVHALVGRNGAGKTTLLRVLLGFVGPSGGTSRVLGEDSATLSAEVRGRIAYGTEEHALPGWMTVASLRALHARTYPRWDEGAYGEVARRFHLPDARRVSHLSNGQRAGLALALALAQSPDILLLDDPTLGLDPVARQTFVETLLFVGKRDETTVIYSSHDLDEVERVADDVIILVDGGLAAFAPPDQIHARISAWILDDLPEGCAIPGLLQARNIEGQTQIVVLDQGADFGSRLEALGARGLTPWPLGFDRAINAFLSGYGTRRDS